MIKQSLTIFQNLDSIESHISNFFQEELIWAASLTKINLT